MNTEHQPKTLQQMYLDAKREGRMTSPARRLVQEIAEAAATSESAVYLWITGRATPSPLARRVLSRHFGRPESELFPEVESNTKKEAAQ